MDLLAPLARYLNSTSFDLKCIRNAAIQEYNELAMQDYYCKHNGWPWKGYYERKLYQFVDHSNPCWEKQLIVVVCTGCLGVLTAMSNLVVFMNILSSRVLRENVTMLLVSNLAFSDFLVATYVVCISLYWNTTPYTDVKDNRRNVCYKFGFLWLLGQCNSVTTSLLLTIERYLVLVFTMNPSMRISRRMAVILLSMFCTLALILTSFSLYHNLYQFSMLCVPLGFSRESNNSLAYFFTLILVAISAASYLVIFILYSHIYIDLKRTALNAGAKVEAKTAKGIALMVFSNLFFFVLPLIVSGVALSINVLSDFAVAVLTSSMPGLSVSINSFLNPLLYAYRT